MIRHYYLFWRFCSEILILNPPAFHSLMLYPVRKNMVATLQVFGADWNVSMVNIQLQKLLWVYCPGHAGMKGNDQADTGSYGTLTSGLLLRRSEMLRSLRHYLRAQSQRHHTTDHVRGLERWSTRRSSLKGWERATVNQTNIGTI